MEKETFWRGFFNSKTITQLIIVVLIVIAVVVYMYNENKQDNDRLKELVRSNENVERLVTDLIEKQGEMNTLIRCIKRAHNEASDNFDIFKKILGRTLANVGLTQFPTDLNEAFSEYGRKFEFIEDCLIFPEDLK